MAERGEEFCVCSAIIVVCCDLARVVEGGVVDEETGGGVVEDSEEVLVVVLESVARDRCGVVEGCVTGSSPISFDESTESSKILAVSCVREDTGNLGSSPCNKILINN